MTTDNVALARRVFGDPGAPPRAIDGAALFEAFTDDVVYTVAGTTRFSGTYRGRDEIVGKLVGPLFAALDGPLEMAVDTVFGDGDHVAVQTRGFARTKRGQRYDNTYCFVLRFRDGKVAAVTEYLDTALLLQVFA